MTEKFIAISAKGHEFLYKRSSMIAVPTKDAQKIADVLNEQKYKIGDIETEVWYVHDNDYMANDYIESEIKRYGKRMPVCRYYG